MHMVKESYLHVGCFDFFAAYSSVSHGSDSLRQHPSLPEVESTAFGSSQRKYSSLLQVLLSQLTTKEAALVAAFKPARELPCYPGKGSSNQLFPTLYLH